MPKSKSQVQVCLTVNDKYINSMISRFCCICQLVSHDNKFSLYKEINCYKLFQMTFNHSNLLILIEIISGLRRIRSVIFQCFCLIMNRPFCESCVDGIKKKCTEDPRSSLQDLSKYRVITTKHPSYLLAIMYSKVLAMDLPIRR